MVFYLHSPQELTITTEYTNAVKMSDEVRKWEDKPYGPNDSRMFSVFERDLMDDLQAAKGFRQVLWNSPSDAGTASWLSKVIYVEIDAADILKESEANADEENQGPDIPVWAQFRYVQISIYPLFVGLDLFALDLVPYPIYLHFNLQHIRF
jgi:hypothetical protein